MWSIKRLIKRQIVFSKLSALAKEKESLTLCASQKQNWTRTDLKWQTRHAFKMLYQINVAVCKYLTPEPSRSLSNIVAADLNCHLDKLYVLEKLVLLPVVTNSGPTHR